MDQGQCLVITTAALIGRSMVADGGYCLHKLLYLMGTRQGFGVVICYIINAILVFKVFIRLLGFRPNRKALEL